MAGPFVYDRVKETSTTTGTGNFTLAGAATGYVTFSSVVGSDSFYYCIAHQTANEWEVGIGTLSGGALARGTVLASTNSGAAVDFSAGTKDVFVSAPAAMLCPLNVTKFMKLTGVIAPTSLAANTDDWNPTGLSNAGVIEIASDSAIDLTGIVATNHADAVLVLYNVGAYVITLKHNATSTAANRFSFTNGNDHLLQPGGSRIFYHNTSTDRWIALSETRNFMTSVTLTGAVTGSGASSVATTLSDDTVTFAKMENIATDRLVGRDTAGTGDPEALTVGGGIEFTGSGGIQRSALTGDVTASAGSGTTTIANDAVTNAKLRDSVRFSVIGRSANSTGDPADIAATAGAGGGLLTYDDSGLSVGWYQTLSAGFVKSSGSLVSVGSIGATDLPALNGFTDADPALDDVIPGYDASATANRDFRLDRIGGFLAPMTDGRLTLLYGDPEPADQTGGAIPTSTDTSADTVTFTSAHGWSTGQGVGVSATGGGLTAGTLYFARVTSTTTIQFHPTFADANANTNKVNLTASITATVVPAIHLEEYCGDKVTVYDGTRCVTLTIPDGLAILPPSGTSTAFDVFAYDNSGTLALELTNWTSAGAGTSARATALAWQNGLRVKSGTATRRYLGSGLTTSVAYQCVDYGVGRPAKRYLFNAHNQVPREVYVAETTDSWNYTTAAWQNANASANNRVECFFGLQTWVDLMVMGRVTNATGSSGAVGIGENATKNDARLKRFDNFPAGITVDCTAFLKKRPILGFNYYQWTEYSTAAGTSTWNGDGGAPTLVQSGILGWVWM